MAKKRKRIRGPRRASQSGRPLVSVIIPTKNRPERLSEAIASALAQSYRALEVVVVNDGGVSVRSVVAATGGGDRVRLIERTTSGGPAVARHDGVTDARGEIIMYLDDDDLWYERHAERLVAAFVSPKPAAMVYTGVEHRHVARVADGWRVVGRVRECAPVFDRALLLVRNTIALNTIAHGKQRYLDVGGFDRSLSVLEDWELILRLTADLPADRSARAITGTTAVYRHFADVAHVNALRREGLDAALRIYAAHPVDDAAIDTARQRHIADLARAVRFAARKQAEPPVPEVLNSVSNAIAAGAPDDAIALLSPTVEALPDDGELAVLLARLLSVSDRSDEAEALVAHARVRDPWAFASAA